MGPTHHRLCVSALEMGRTRVQRRACQARPRAPQTPLPNPGARRGYEPRGLTRLVAASPGPLGDSPVTRAGEALSVIAAMWVPRRCSGQASVTPTGQAAGTAGSAGEGSRGVGCVGSPPGGASASGGPLTRPPDCGPCPSQPSATLKAHGCRIVSVRCPRLRGPRDKHHGHGGSSGTLSSPQFRRLQGQDRGVGGSRSDARPPPGCRRGLQRHGDHRSPVFLEGHESHHGDPAPCPTASRGPHLHTLGVSVSTYPRAGTGPRPRRPPR